MEGTFLTPKRSEPIFDDTNEVVRVMREQPPTHCILKVESFSLLQNQYSKHNDHFKTTEFRTGGYRWVLSVYPNGNHEENGDGHLSLYVEMIDKLSNGCSVTVALRFFIYDQIRDNYLAILDVREKRFQAVKNKWGIAKVLPLSTFTDASNGFLVNDCCVFGAEVLVNVQNNEPEVSVLNEQCELRSSEYSWRIEKFSELKDPLYSPVFTFEGRSWTLFLHPRGNNDGKEKSLSLYLHLDKHHILTDGSKLHVKFAMCLKNQLKGSNHEKCTEWSVSSTKRDWGYSNFIPLSELRDPFKGFVVDDAIIIKIRVEEISILKGIKS